jgi:AAA+ ATPase superfamily predicted ATPase
LSFRDAIEYVFLRAKDGRIILAIDEYPYLAGCDSSVSSVLQAAIDKYKDGSKLFLILCGSSMSFMETQVVGYKSPLYGRRTAQYKILPVDYYESAEMLAGFTAEEKIILYGVTGGTPEYLSRIDHGLSVRQNIQGLFFEPSGRLFEEPSNLLKQELKMPETYNAIITAIAGGSSKLNEIATKAGIETSQCSKMLLSLIALGLVRKEYPVTEPNSKKTLYLLNDWMFVFWYRFVQPEMSRIMMKLGGEACADMFVDGLQSHTGRVFEECAAQYMWRLLKDNKSPVAFKKIGRWWGNNPALRREEEIDFIAFSGKEAVFGECKWRNQPQGEEVLDDLIRKSELFPNFTGVKYMLFSKCGFTGALAKRAAGGNTVFLVCPGDMF